MYINRGLLLTIALAFVFIPAVDDWLWAGGEGWYRPFLLWLAAIIAAWWNLQRPWQDEL